MGDRGGWCGETSALAATRVAAGARGCVRRRCLHTTRAWGCATSSRREHLLCLAMLAYALFFGWWSLRGLPPSRPRGSTLGIFAQGHVAAWQAEGAVRDPDGIVFLATTPPTSFWGSGPRSTICGPHPEDASPAADLCAGDWGRSRSSCSQEWRSGVRGWLWLPTGVLPVDSGARVAQPGELPPGQLRGTPLVVRAVLSWRVLGGGPI